MNMHLRGPVVRQCCIVRKDTENKSVSSVVVCTPTSQRSQACCEALHRRGGNQAFWSSCRFAFLIGMGHGNSQRRRCNMQRSWMGCYDANRVNADLIKHVLCCVLRTSGVAFRTALRIWQRRGAGFSLPRRHSCRRLAHSPPYMYVLAYAALR